ncbi:MAG TPA: hypothetical protein DCL54_10660 [Alphaproteobacteria bacterium]|nr:hypothetical protein [Alphaproteobacteria bacterium]HAJ47029.1 hypothetical protein [Alphaproteobacteria bacterium]
MTQVLIFSSIDDAKILGPLEHELERRKIGVVNPFHDFASIGAASREEFRRAVWGSDRIVLAATSVGSLSSVQINQMAGMALGAEKPVVLMAANTLTRLDIPPELSWLHIEFVDFSDPKAIAEKLEEDLNPIAA